MYHKNMFKYYSLFFYSAKNIISNEKCFVYKDFIKNLFLLYSRLRNNILFKLRRINIQLSRNPCSNHTLHNSKRRGELSSPQCIKMLKYTIKKPIVIAGANAPFQTGTRCLIIPITFLTIIYTANTIPVTDR